MAETYIVGETKVRPGAYFNIQKQGTNAQADVVNGVTAVVFKSDFGPLNTAVELSAEDGFASTFGNGGTTDDNHCMPCGQWRYSRYGNIK